MTITLVDVGTTANDGTGDPLRTAFQTVNTALTRLNNTVDVQTGYVLLKDDSGTAGAVVTTAGNVGIGTTNPLKPLHVVGQAVFGANTGTVGSTAAVFTATSSYSSGVEIRNPDAAGWARLDLKHDSASDGFLMYQDASGGVFFRNNSGASTLMQWLNGASPLMTLLASGSFGVGTTSPTEALDVNSDAVRLRTSQTPASATATGNAGTICWDSNYIYVCTATNTWKRAALATW